MFAHASRNPAPASRSMSHVGAVADVPSATGLIWPHIVGAENHAILFGYERLFVMPHPIGHCRGFCHVRIVCICSGFTNDREDDPSDIPGITCFGFYDMHGARLEVRALCLQGLSLVGSTAPARGPLRRQQRTNWSGTFDALSQLAATCPGQQQPRSSLRSLLGGRPRKGDLPLAPQLSLSCVLPEIVPSRAISSDHLSTPHTSSVWSARPRRWFARRTARWPWILVLHKGPLLSRAEHRLRNI